MQGRTLLFALAALALLALVATAQPTKKPWTLLIWLDGNNNLDDYASDNIEAMMKADNPNVNIVATWASSSAMSADRIVISHMKKIVVQHMGESEFDMGNYTNLIDFLEWGIKNYPADHYFIDAWDHGSGWEPMGESKWLYELPKKMEENHHKQHHKTIRDVSYDENSGNAISTKQIGIAMKAAKAMIGHNVDVYGSDACLMAMVEVNNELAGSVDYVLGSEDTEPGLGWVYDKWLNQWGTTPLEVATCQAKLYGKARDSATMSVVDMSKLDTLTNSMKVLAGAMANNLPATRKAVKQSWDSDAEQTHIDIGNFVSHFMPQSDPSKAVQDALSKHVVYSIGSGPDKNVTGMAVWIPLTTQTEHISIYKSLNYDQITGWSSMLAKLWK